MCLCLSVCIVTYLLACVCLHVRNHGTRMQAYYARMSASVSSCVRGFMYACIYARAHARVCGYLCMYVCACVCLSVCLFVCLSVCLSVCIYTYPLIDRHMHLWAWRQMYSSETYNIVAHATNHSALTLVTQQHNYISASMDPVRHIRTCLASLS